RRDLRDGTERPADGRQGRLKGRLRGVLVDAACGGAGAADLDGNRGERFRGRARRERVLVEADDRDVDAEPPADRTDQRLDETLIAASDLELADVALEAEAPGRHVRLGAQVVADEPPAGRHREKLALEELADLQRGHLLTGTIRLLLDDAADRRMQPLRQRDAVVALEHERDAALAGLAVDPDDLLVAAAEVARVDRQVGDGPVLEAVLAVIRHRLPDRVLVAPRERSVDELAGPWVTRVHRHVGAALV